MNSIDKWIHLLITIFAYKDSKGHGYKIEFPHMICIFKWILPISNTTSEDCAYISRLILGDCLRRSRETSIHPRLETNDKPKKSLYPSLFWWTIDVFLQLPIKDLMSKKLQWHWKANLSVKAEPQSTLSNLQAVPPESIMSLSNQ